MLRDPWRPSWTPLTRRRRRKKRRREINTTDDVIGFTAKRTSTTRYE
jgi:hypothetical protein